MKDINFSHVEAGNPRMVDITGKKPTQRTACAQAIVDVGPEIGALINDNEIQSAKGPVFQTAIIAGVMGGKKTSELIPFCHALCLEDLQIEIRHEKNKIFITSFAKLEGKTGVEMEALTSVSVAALTIYDMCKAISHDIQIDNISLLEKTGGKNDFKKP